MTRIKMFGAIPRAKHLTPQQFHDHYRHPHGTLGRHISTMRAYVQNHQVHTDLLGEEQTRFEACAEVWFDNVEDAITFPSEPIYVRDLIPDEPLFVDMPNLRFCFAVEEVLMSSPNLREDISDGDKAWRIDNRPNSFKLVQFIEKDGETPWDQDDDFDLGRRIGALRHVRCRPAPELHPDGAFVVGIRELWWPTQTHMEAGAAADPEAWNALTKRGSVSTSFAGSAERFI